MIGLLLAAVAQSSQTNVQVDIVAPADTRITIQRIAPYSIVLTNNTTHDITGLTVDKEDLVWVLERTFMTEALRNTTVLDAIGLFGIDSKTKAGMQEIEVLT